jgi:two-component system response regulator MtrA
MGTSGETLDPHRYTITLDDDPMISKIIERATGIRSLAFTSAQKLLSVCQNHHPIAAFIDINLDTEECGLDVIPALRAHWSYCPILVITADPEDETVGRSLHSGADDFILKPLRPNELIARLQTRLGDFAERRSKNTVRLGDARLDPTLRCLEGPLGKRYLSPTGVKILLCLWQAKGTVVSRQRLKRQGWHEMLVSETALDRKLYEVRHALKEVSENLTLRSVYGKGSRLEKKP